jgi:hypothetical protein
MAENGMETPTIAQPEKQKSQPSAGKLRLTIFRYSQGPVLDSYQERGTTLSSASYSEMLNDNRLKPAIWSKC